LISGNFSFKTFSEIRKTLDNENRWTDNKYLFFFFLKGRREVVIRDEHQKYKANITRPEVIHGKYFPNGNIT
jgi:hypothetical protein